MPECAWLTYRVGNQTVCKLSKPDFVNTIDKYDIVCLLETKVDPSISLKFNPQYIEKSLYRNNRKLPNRTLVAWYYI